MLVGASTATGVVPVALRVSVCGLPGAVSATLSVAVRAPTADGVTVKLITHDPVLAISTKLAVQVVVPGTIAKSPAFAPVMVTGVPAARVADTFPVFVTVTVTEPLVVPTR